MEEKSFKRLEEENHKELINILKRYVNLYKSLHMVDPAIAAEFKKKQEAFHKIENSHEHSGNCCESKLNNHSMLKII